MGWRQIRNSETNPEFLSAQSIVSFTSLSEKALIYYEWNQHKIFSMGKASAIDEQNFQDYLLREFDERGPHSPLNSAESRQ